MASGDAQGVQHAHAERSLIVWFPCGATHPPSRSRFEEECATAGATAVWLDPHGVEVSADGTALYQGELAELPDVVVPRTGGLTTERALAALRALEEIGVPMVNGTRAVAACASKLATHETLHAAGVGVPATEAVEGVLSRAQAAAIAELLGGFPVVVKPDRGMRGTGVRLAATADELGAATAGEGGGASLVAQQFIAGGSDVRVIVVGSRALGAMRRNAAPGEFRANLELGAEPVAEPLTDDLASAACAATRAMGAEVAGVDLAPGPEGWLVLEVNSAPGFSGFESVTGVNVAAAIVEYALERVRR